MAFIPKKLLLLFVFLLVGSCVFAQVRVGVKAGLNLADMKYEPEDETNGTPDANSLPSFNAGFIVDVPLIQGLALQPGLMVSGKGSKVEYTTNNLGNYTTTINPIYLEVPVNILFKPQIGAGTRLYFGAGPYFAVGIAGKQKFTFEGAPIIGDGYTGHQLKFGNSSDDDLKATDVGAQVLAGFEFSKGLLVGAQYGIGFTNIAPDNNSSNNKSKILRNKVLSFSVGYLFGK